MKTTVNFSQFVDAFHAHDRYDSFGYDGLRVIFDALEDYEDSTGSEVELDVIAICCDFNMEDWRDVAKNYSIDLSEAGDDEDDQKEIVLEYLNDNTWVLGECVDGVIYQVF